MNRIIRSPRLLAELEVAYGQSILQLSKFRHHALKCNAVKEWKATLSKEVISIHFLPQRQTSSCAPPKRHSLYIVENQLSKKAEMSPVFSLCYSWNETLSERRQRCLILQQHLGRVNNTRLSIRDFEHSDPTPWRHDIRSTIGDCRGH